MRLFDAEQRNALVPRKKLLEMQLLGANATLKNNSDDVVAWVQKASALMYLQRMEEAWPAVQEADRLGAMDDVYLYARAQVLTEIGGDIGEARRCLEDANALKPDRPAYHVAYGMLLLSLGEMEKGWRECEWRHLLDPEPS